MRYDAIVIGGGVIGLSIAWRLGERGARTLLLERDVLGAGTSSRGVGGFRQQFTTPINIALSRLSLPVFQALGAEIALCQHGYLYLALSDAERRTLHRRVALQHSYAVPVEWLEPDEIHARFPYLAVDDVRGAAFCAADGYLTPALLLAAYARRARATGVQIAEGVAVVGIHTVGGRVTGVETSQGPFDAPVVVNATGPWAAHIAAMVGVDVPVVPLKRQVWLSEPTTAVPPTAPLTIDADTGWHFRPRDGALLFAMSGGEQPGDERLDLDLGLAEQLLAGAAHRLPGARIELARGWAGLYEVTPDAHPVLGMARQLHGFYLACGFSGHGVMHSPAVGLLMAALICGDAPALDVNVLALDRFVNGQLLAEASVL